MATLAQRRPSGPLADYSSSFGGLGDFYDLQKPGATQRDRLQQQAHGQQVGADGFYRPGSRPEPEEMPERDVTPRGLPSPLGQPSGLPPAPGSSVRRSGLPGQADVLELAPNDYGTGHSTGVGMPSLSPAPRTPGNTETVQLFGRQEAPENPALVNGMFAAPPGMNGPNAYAAPAGLPSFGGAVPAGGRSMSDPNRIMEGLARRNRGNPRMQMAAAGFFQENADRASAMEAGRAAAQYDMDKFNATQQGLANRNNATIAGQNARQDIARQDAANRAQVEWQQKLYNDNLKETQRQLQPLPQFLPVDGSGGGVIMQGQRPLSGYLPTPGAATPGMMEFPGGLGVPTLGGKPVPGLPTYQQTSPARPAQTLPTFPQATSLPAQPAQYAPAAAAKKPNRIVPIKMGENYYDRDDETGEYIPVRIRGQQGDASAASPQPAASAPSWRTKYPTS